MKKITPEQLEKSADRYVSDLRNEGLDFRCYPEEQIKQAYIDGFNKGAEVDTTFPEFISSMDLGTAEKNIVRGVYYQWAKENKNDEVLPYTLNSFKEKILVFLYGEVIERRDYSASKSFEVVIEKINELTKI